MTGIIDIPKKKDAAMVAAPEPIAKLPAPLTVILLADFSAGKDLANLSVCNRVWKEATKKDTALRIKIWEAMLAAKRVAPVLVAKLPVPLQKFILDGFLTSKDLVNLTVCKRRKWQEVAEEDIALLRKNSGAMVAANPDKYRGGIH